MITGNDDSIRSKKLITSKVADVILSAKREENNNDGEDEGDEGNDGPDLQPAGVPKTPAPGAGELEVSLLEEFDDEEDNR